jgi:uncharacterized YigZ family protein
MTQYIIPAGETRVEFKEQNSRFISTAAPVFSVDEANTFITRIKEEFSDASHNVPVYIIGHGASVITHCGDDGEPSGTAGRPALAVLTGSGFGDIAIVITRYFGGTKLGKGGLVRAYSNAVRLLIDSLPRAEKLLVHTIRIEMPYSWFDRMERLVESHSGWIIEKDFAIEVSITAGFAVDNFPAFENALQQASHGSLHAEIIDTQYAIVPVSG